MNLDSGDGGGGGFHGGEFSFGGDISHDGDIDHVGEVANVGDASHAGDVAHSGDTAHSGDEAKKGWDHSAPENAFGDSGTSMIPLTDPASASTDEDDDASSQGPSMAYTATGVSDVNLSGAELALMKACYDGDAVAMGAQLDAGAAPDCADVNRRTPLHFAAAHGLPTLCRRLKDAGVGLNAQDLMGYTALHMAVGYERVETVRELLKLGADANVCTFEDRLPVEIAETALESTRETRVLGWVTNGEVMEKRKKMVEILDEATEEHEEDDEEDDEPTLKAEEGMTVVVRKREPVDAKVKAPPSTVPVADSDVKVTIRVKKPEKKN